MGEADPAEGSQPAGPPPDSTSPVLSPSQGTSARRLPPLPSSARKSPSKATGSEHSAGMSPTHVRSNSASSSSKPTPLGERTVPPENARVSEASDVGEGSSRRASTSPRQSKRAGSQRTRFSMDDTKGGSSSVWSSESSEAMTVRVQDASLGDAPPSYPGTSEEGHRDPMLVSVEDEQSAPIIQEVDPNSDYDMDHNRAMTPGPPSRHERDGGSTLSTLHISDLERSVVPSRPEDIEWEDLPDVFKRRRGSSRLDIQADWDTLDEWKSADQPDTVDRSYLFGPGVTPSRLVNHEIHPHAGAVCLQELSVQVPESDEDMAKLEFSFALRGELENALPSGPSETWFYCTTCCAWSCVRMSSDADSWPAVLLPPPGSHEDVEPTDAGTMKPATSADGPSPAPPTTSAPAPTPGSLPYSVTNDDEAVAAFKSSIQAQRNEHPRAHHFHAFRSLNTVDIAHAILPPPKSHDHGGPIRLEARQTSHQVAADVWSCCQCDIRVQVPAQAPVLGCFSADLFGRLAARPAALNKVQTSHTVLTDALFALSGYIQRALIVTDKRACFATDSRTYIDSIGFDEAGRELIQRAGFRFTVQRQPNGGSKNVFETVEELHTEAGAQERQWLLRAWFELNAHLTELDAEKALKARKDMFLKITFAPLSEPLKLEMQAYAELVAQGQPRPMRFARVHRRPPTRPTAEALEALGAHHTDSSRMLHAAFLSQTFCDAAESSTYMDQLEVLAEGDYLNTEERDYLKLAGRKQMSKGLAKTFELDWAYRELKIDTDILVSMREGTAATTACQQEEYIYGQAKAQLEATDVIDVDDPIPSVAATLSRQIKLLDYLERIQTARRSSFLKDCLQKLTMRYNPLREAYDTIMAPNPHEIADDFWEAEYSVEMADVGSNIERKNKLRQAFLRIAEHKQLAGLALSIREEMENEEGILKPRPVGLQNIGNTCYLNSLLQYLATIKPLRHTLEQIDPPPKAVLDASDVQRKVGGRLITPAEVDRSVKFTKELKSLFSEMATADDSSIRPAQNLAYLALVTASDEQAAKPAATGPVPTAPETFSGSSDATLVNEEATRPASMGIDAPPSAPLSPPSILGKRSSEDREEVGDLDTRLMSSSSTGLRSGSSDSSTHKPPRTLASIRSRSLSHLESSTEPTNSGSDDVVMGSPAKEESALPGTDAEAGPENTGKPEQPATTTPPTAPPPLPHRATSTSVNVNMMFGQQHDVSECMDNILFQIEASLGASPDVKAEDASINLVESLFYGKSKQILLPASDTSPAKPQESEVKFNSLLLAVADEGPRDLYDGLHDLYFGQEEVEVEGKTALKREELVQLPPLLHVQLQRVQFDRESARVYKSNAYVKFDESIYLDRFAASAEDPRKEASSRLQAQIKQKRERLRALKYAKPSAIPDLLLGVNEILQGLREKDVLDGILAGDDADGLSLQLSADSSHAQAEITRLEQEIVTTRQELDALWVEDRQEEYELSSVFMHRGQAGFGHYWLYQRNLPDSPDEYFHFNDERVTRIDKQTVYGDTGSNANPYLLVYVKKGSGVVDTIKRLPRQEKNELASAWPSNSAMDNERAMAEALVSLGETKYSPPAGFPPGMAEFHATQPSHATQDPAHPAPTHISGVDTPPDDVEMAGASLLPGPYPAVSHPPHDTGSPMHCNTPGPDAEDAATVDDPADADMKTTDAVDPSKEPAANATSASPVTADAAEPYDDSIDPALQ